MTKKRYLLLALFVLGLTIVLNVLFLRGYKNDNSAKQLVTELLTKAGIQVNGPQPWDITIHDEAFYSRVVSGGSLALGETYMEGMWDAKAVDQFIYHLLKADIDGGNFKSWSVLWTAIKARLFNLQNKTKSLEVIDIHYNLGNELYQKMLGSSMAYSCGYWKDARTLDAAQYAKYDLICRKLKLKPGMRILDVGCGFGGLAKFAAENYKVSVLGITLSENQAEFGRALCKDLPVEIRVQDYRDLTEQFDAIVSVGMFEHVGPKNYLEYMEIARKSLKDNGLFLLHTIGSNTSNVIGEPWISKYIFPGGLLPSIAQIGTSTETLFVMEDWQNFGAYYDPTLMAWHANFEKNWPELKHNYNETFYRMWNYYLLSCAAAFRARDIQLWQVVLSKNGVPGGYISVR